MSMPMLTGATLPIDTQVVLHDTCDGGIPTLGRQKIRDHLRDDTLKGFNSDGDM